MEVGIVLARTRRPSRRRNDGERLACAIHRGITNKPRRNSGFASLITACVRARTLVLNFAAQHKSRARNQRFRETHRRG